MKKSKKHDRAVKNAYCELVNFRKFLEDKGRWERAKEVEETYKELWCETLNEPHPWR